MTQALRDPQIPQRSSGSARKSWFRSSWDYAAITVALVVAAATAAGLGSTKDTSTTTRASQDHVASIGAKKHGATTTESDQLAKKTLTIQDRQAAREDAQQKSLSSGRAAPSGTWLVGSVGT